MGPQMKVAPPDPAPLLPRDPAPTPTLHEPVLYRVPNPDSRLLNSTLTRNPDHTPELFSMHSALINYTHFPTPHY